MVQVTQQQIKSGRYKRIDGIWHKLCSGSAHEIPEWLPATEKYYYYRKKSRRPLSQCRLCQAWDKVKNPGSHHGYVDIRVARPFYEEAVNRIGMTELANRSGLSMHQIQRVFLSTTRKYVQKNSLRRVMLELVSIHRKNEYVTNPRVSWQTERRNGRGLDKCNKCGTPRSNITRGCGGCYERWRDKYKNGQITKKRWDEIRIESFPQQLKLHHGKLVKTQRIKT